MRIIDTAIILSDQMACDSNRNFDMQLNVPLVRVGRCAMMLGLALMASALLVPVKFGNSAMAAQNQQVVSPPTKQARETAEPQTVTRRAPKPATAPTIPKIMPVKAPSPPKEDVVYAPPPPNSVETVEEYDPVGPPRFPVDRPIRKLFDILESDDGATLHLVGAIEAGVAKALRLKLQSNPGVKRLVLSSTGGSIIEGVALAHLVTRHGLETHVEFVCASACTLPFLRGKMRTVSRDAGLGFHSSSGGFVDFARVKANRGGNALMRDFYRQANVDAEIIERAVATAPEDFWFPEAAQLKSGNVVAALLAPDSLSFPKGAWQTIDSVNAMTSKDSYWKKLKQNWPTYYHLARSELWTAGILGGNIVQAEYQSLIALKKLFLSEYSYFPDELVDELTQLENQFWPSYSNYDITKCRYIGGVGIPVGAPITVDEKKQQAALLDKMATIKSNKTVPDEGTLTDAQAKVFSFLGLVVSETDYTNYSVKTNFCSKPSDYYRILMQMPTEQRIAYFKALTLNQPQTPFY